MDSQIRELEKEYCPPLDNSLFFAIVLDFDLEVESEYRRARETLDELRISAAAEDTAGFDPSGSSNPRDVRPDEVQTSNSLWSDDTDILSAGSTSVTDITSSLDAFTFEDSPASYDKGIDSMNDEEKKELLHEMFQTVKAFDIDFIFKKKRGDFGPIVEELLNLKFLQEDALVNENEPLTPRGIDGFADLGIKPRKGKSKSKKHARRNEVAAAVDLQPRLVDGQVSSANRWRKGQDDVEFITDRTKLTETYVKSVYNSSEHSLRKSLVTICKTPVKDLTCTGDLEDVQVQTNIVDLATEYPRLSNSTLTTIIMLTHPLFAAAKDLANVLSTGAEEHIVPHYASTKLSEHRHHDSDNDTINDSQFLASSAELPVGSSYEHLRQTAFAQASAAYRKSRSSPHMGGAAAYYASVGHAANAALKRERALEANARVARQSSSIVNCNGPATSAFSSDGDDFCDLHGVTIADAVRISKQYVARWWEKRQEWAQQGSVKGSGAQYRVVVGRGSHSVEGKGKLGPAVAKALKADGWRVDEQIGEIIVRGRMRK